MPRKSKKYHILYKTTCLITARWYIGVHSTNDLDDGYFGSGKRIHASVKKYGLENHMTEILEQYEDRKTLMLRESEIVTKELLQDPLCMNLTVGGGGSNGYEGMLNKEKEDELFRRLSNATRTKWEDETFRKKRKESLEKTWSTEEYKEKIRAIHMATWQQEGHAEKMRDAKLLMWQNEEYAEKMRAIVRETNAKHIGSIWIFKDEFTKSKRIRPEEFEYYVSLGYKRGKRRKNKKYS